MEKLKPTADCIVARLIPSWGSIVSLLFKTTEPYTHYYDVHGEEVPYGAIASWTDVELPPESEDERIRQGLLYFIKKEREKKHLTWDDIPLDVYEAYLEKQKEQKPVSGSSEKPNNHKEWSEEDERKLNRIYEILGYAADDKGFLTSKRIIGDNEAIELQDFLKSLCLRSRWKPSEEQMNYLCAVVNEAKRKHNISVSGYPPARILESLYNDLKKL